MTEHKLLNVSLAAACIALLGATGQAFGAQAQRGVFGTLANGKRIDSVELTSAAGIRVRIITLGARIQSIYTPDRKGKLGDIVLGFSNPQAYVKYGNYF
ncbi:Aldose 1-epimerase, partial [mine drainage metagenome]